MEIATVPNHEIKPPRRIINTCNTCRTPIYEGEAIYSSSREKNTGKSGGLQGGLGAAAPLTGSQGGLAAGAYDGTFGSNTSGEVWVQCAWCYDQWQEEVESANDFGIDGEAEKQWWISF